MPEDPKSLERRIEAQNEILRNTVQDNRIWIWCSRCWCYFYRGDALCKHLASILRGRAW